MTSRFSQASREGKKRSGPRGHQRTQRNAGMSPVVREKSGGVEGDWASTLCPQAPTANQLQPHTPEHRGRSKGSGVGGGERGGRISKQEPNPSERAWIYKSTRKILPRVQRYRQTNKQKNKQNQFHTNPAHPSGWAPRATARPCKRPGPRHPVSNGSESNMNDPNPNVQRSFPTTQQHTFQFKRSDRWANYSTRVKYLGF